MSYKLAKLFALIATVSCCLLGYDIITKADGIDSDFFMGLFLILYGPIVLFILRLKANKKGIAKEERRLITLITSKNIGKVIVWSVVAIIIIICVIIKINSQSSSRWSQLTDEEKDVVRRNAQIYEEIKDME